MGKDIPRTKKSHKMSQLTQLPQYSLIESFLKSKRPLNVQTRKNQPARRLVQTDFHHEFKLSTPTNPVCHLTIGSRFFTLSTNIT